MKTIPSQSNVSKFLVGSNAVIPTDLPCETQQPGSPVAKANAAISDFETFPFRQLLRIARQSGIADPRACASSLTLLKTGRAVHHSLIRTLKPLGLSEGRFVALVALYALDPIPVSSADLAYHTEITRPAMTGLLDTLVKRGWVRRRHRQTKDRRFSRISLTEKGCEIAVFAIYRFLKSAAEISGDLTSAQHVVFDKLCAQLRRRSL